MPIITRVKGLDQVVLQNLKLEINLEVMHL